MGKGLIRSGKHGKFYVKAANALPPKSFCVKLSQ
jgi:hypothetical protein